MSKELTDTFTIGTSVVSALISLASAVWAYKSGRFASDVQRVELKRQYFSELRAWAGEVVDAISDAIVEIDPSIAGEGLAAAKHKELCAKLSALIDRGRWFFPNINSDEFGQHKELAFRGYRHEVLDGIVNAYQVLERVDSKQSAANADARVALISARKEFVSHIQAVLQPRQLDEEFRRLTQSSAPVVADA
jgi:hypothetical protein